MFTSVYLAEQKYSGKYIGKVEQIRNWLEKNSALPIKDAAEFAGITVRQFEQVLSLIKAHPDLDDEEISNMTDWRKW